MLVTAHRCTWLSMRFWERIESHVQTQIVPRGTEFELVVRTRLDTTP